MECTRYGSHFPETNGVYAIFDGYDTSLSRLSTPNPTFCGQYFLDTQDPSLYVSTVKKEVLIKKLLQ
jgi:hypothetical protein